MKSDKIDPQEPVTEAQEEQVVEVTLPQHFRAELKRARLNDLLADLDAAYSGEMNKLAEMSVKFKSLVEDAKTKTKNSYYESKLKKNNEKIYDLLVQYENSRRVLIEAKKQADEETQQDGQTDNV